MPKFQADVSPGKLQTESRIPVGYSGESLARIVPNMKYSACQAFVVQISSWVARKKILEYEKIYYLYTQALESLRVSPSQMNTYGKLVYHVSKIGLEEVLKDSEAFREYLLNIHFKIEEILLSPRSLGSQEHRRLIDLDFKIVIKPGKEKHHFPEVSYIGVGYRDKGHSRNKSFDGRPCWQELCSATNLKISTQENKKPQKRYQHLNQICQLSWKDLKDRQYRRTMKMRQQSRSLLY